MYINSHKLADDSITSTVILQRLLNPTVAIGLALGLSELFDIHIPGFRVQGYGLVFILSILSIPVVWHLSAPSQSQTETSALPARILHILLNWGTMLAIFLVVSSFASASPLLSWIILIPLGVYLLHLSMLFILRNFQNSKVAQKAIIVGSNALGRQLSQQIQASRSLNLNFQGFFDNNPDVDDRGIPSEQILGSLDKLPAYIQAHQIQVVYIALPSREESTIVSLLEQLQDTTACVYLVPNLPMLKLQPTKAYGINGIPVLALWEIPFSGLQYTLKRALDIFLSGLILIILSPLLLLIALGVRLSSPGPCLFKQRRHGINGQEIVVYKFRTMRVMEEGNVVIQAQRNDSRVTPFGAFLRRTSLDELPQFINVLQGRMSIVGPRPHAIVHNEQYRKLIGGYMLRHKVKPGITGWAQVNGLRGETETVEKMEKRVEFDLFYLNNWSLGLDIQIILRSALVFFQSKNAY